MSKYHPLDSTLKKIYHKVGLNHNLQDYKVHEIMDSMYKFIYDRITENEIRNLEDLESFDNTKTNFNLIYLGKLIIPRERFKKRNHKWNKTLKEQN